MHFLKKFYDKTLKYDLINVFNFNANKSYNKLPKLKKIILSFNFKTSDIKKLSSSLLALELITKQQTKIIKAKKPNVLLKIYKGDAVGCKLIIKKKNLFSFLNKTLEIFSKLKRFNGFSIKHNYKINVFTYQLWNLLYFIELKNYYNYFFNLSELQVLIIVSSVNKKELIFLFKSLRFPLQKKC